MSDATETLKVRLAISRARLEMMKAKKMSGGYSRHPSGSSKGGQFAPKGTNSFGNPSDPAPFKSGGNTFIEVGGPGWGSYQKPKGPPPGAKPHPAGLDDKGNPVTVNYPTKPSSKDTWGNKDATATFVPGGDAPSTLNGVSMKSWSPPKEGWHAVGGNNERLEALFPFDRPSDGKSTGAGVLIVEPDGRIWLTKPTNEFGGYKQTYPKGTVESGLTMQQNAIKEAYEETGLKIKITGVLGDYDRTTSRARMYIAEREGGTPKDMGWESQAVRLSSMKDAKTLLNMSHDKKILQDLEDLIAIGKSKGGSWQNQARWPAGTPLGGQWKAMGADGITLPPLIAGGLDAKNPAYQKFVNAAHAAAQAGNYTALNTALDKYKDKFSAFMDGQKGSSHLKWMAQAHQYVVQATVDAGTKPLAAATVDRIKGPDKLSDMGPPVGPKPGGSNPGALYNQGGDTWLVKGSNAAKHQDTKTIEDRSKNEVLAAKLMLAAGVGAPDMKLVQLGDEYNGGLGVASKWVDGLKKFDVSNTGHVAAAQADFAVHAWLANYDVLGTGGFDNTSIKDGKAINIDTGGALLFRAQGEKKGAESGVKDGLLKPDAPEFESMRGFNSEQKTVYGTMTASQLASSAEKLNNISDDTIKSLVKTYGPGDDAFKDKLAQNLIDRKNAVLQKAGVVAAASVAPPAAVPAGTVDLASIKTASITPTLSKTAFSGENKLFYQQYDPQTYVTAGTATAFGQPPSAQAKEYAETILAAQAAGFKPQKFKVSGLQQAYVYVKEGNVLTQNGAKALLTGATAQTAPAAVAPTPPKKEEVEAKILATAMKEVDTTTKLVKNQLANDPDKQYPFPSDVGVKATKVGASAGVITLAEKADFAFLAGDMSGLAMVKVGAMTVIGTTKSPEDLVVAGTVVKAAQTGMEKLAADAAKASLSIAAAAPKIEIPPKPVFPNAKTGSKYYNGLADKAEKLAAAGDLAGLKAFGTSGTYAGGVPWKPGTANGKVMASYHSALVATLEQKGAAGVVARVQQAAKAMEKPAPVPTPIEAAQKALPAMPNIQSLKIAGDGKNAKANNPKIDQIDELAKAGDVKGLLSMGFGTNTYGKKQAKVVNDALAALGSPHVVTPGQKPNAHPALYGGVTAAQATAAAAKVDVALPPNSPAPAAAAKAAKAAVTTNDAWMKLNPGDKVVEQGEEFGIKYAKIETPAKGFSPSEIPGPPDFFKNGSQGPTNSWKSSKAEVNEANNAAVALIHSTAVSGKGTDAVKTLKFDVGGKLVGIKDHPAAAVKEYHNQVVSELAAQLRPGSKIVQSGSFTGAYNDAAQKLAETHQKVAYEDFKNAARAADFVVLSKDGASPIPLPQKGAFKEMEGGSANRQSYKKESAAAYAKLSETEKQAAKDYTGSSYGNWNSALRNGEVDSKFFAGAQPLVNAFKKASTDIPEGTVLWRGIDVGQSTFESVVGGVIQDGSFNSASYGDKPAAIGASKDTWLRIHVTKGVKGLDATNFSIFDSGEREIIVQNGVRYAVLKVEHHKVWTTSKGAKFSNKTIVDVIALPHAP